MWSHVQRVVCLNGLKFLIVSHYLVKFSGLMLGGSSSDTAAKIFFVTLQDHIIKRSGDFMGGNYSLYIPTLTKLVAVDIVLMNIYL